MVIESKPQQRSPDHGAARPGAEMAQTRAQGLRTNYLPFPAVLSQSVGCIGPSPAAAIAPSLIFATAGNGTWLSIVIAGAGSILVAMTIVYFARSIASSGSFYAYAASSLGPVGGIMAAWGLLLAYLLSAPAATVVFGVYSTKTFSLRDSPGLLIAIYVVLAVIAAYLAFRDVKFSARLALVIEMISIALLLTLAVIVLAKHHFAFDTAQLRLKGASFTGLRQGLVLAAGMFAGFENAAALGGEAKNPYRTIPLVILSSVVIVGVYFVLMAYTEVLGFQNAGQAFKESSAPLNDLANRENVAFLSRLIDVGLSIGMFGGVLACMNAASRMLYTMGRDGLLPAALGRAHPKYRTPYIALAVCAVPTILLPVALALAGVKLEDVLGYLGTWGEYGFLVAYPIISVAAGFYLHKTSKLKPINVLVCTLATALMLFVFAGQLYPIPPFPYNIFPYLLLGYLAIGLLWCLYMRLRRPQLLARVGKGLTSGDDAAMPAET